MGLPFCFLGSGGDGRAAEKSEDLGKQNVTNCQKESGGGRCWEKKSKAPRSDQKNPDLVSSSLENVNGLNQNKTAPKPQAPFHAPLWQLLFESHQLRRLGKYKE